jgi:hypothetical protein
MDEYEDEDEKDWCIIIIMNISGCGGCFVTLKDGLIYFVYCHGVSDFGFCLARFLVLWIVVFSLSSLSHDYFVLCLVKLRVGYSE